MWRVNSERAVFGAGSQALLKQLAYPPVAEALNHTGKLERSPVERLAQNAYDGLGLIYGTPQEVMAISSRVNEAHKKVSGKISETTGAHTRGTAYSARTQEGLGIVAATLIEGSVLGYETFVASLSDSQKNEYVTEAKQLFSFMNLRTESLPTTYDGIRQHIQQMIDDGKLYVGKTARELAPYTMLSNTLIGEFGMSFQRLFTFDLLSEELMNQYRYRITAGQRRFAHATEAGIRKSLPHLPDRVRYNAQYLEAQRRLKSA